MNATITKVLLIAAIVIGLGKLMVKKSVDFGSSSGDRDPDSLIISNQETINPVVIDKLRQVLANLDKTVNTGSGFDYWPNGGIRIAYYHLATFISYQAISNLSPYPVFVSGPHGTVNLNLNSSQTFGHYNPKFIRWFQDHLIEVLDKSFVQLTRDSFQTYLGNTTKTYWATYTILNQHPEEFNALLQDYEQRLTKRSVPDSYYYNIAWQENSDRYNSLSELSATYDMNVVAPAVYFWLRRHIDGTDEQVFAMLEHLLSTYEILPAGSLYYNSEELPIPFK